MLGRIRKAIYAGLLGEGGVFATAGIDYDNPAWWISVVVVPFATGFVGYWLPNEPGTLTRAEPPRKPLP